MGRPSTEESRVRARYRTRQRIGLALDEMSRNMFNGDTTPEERRWFFFTALRRIEDAEHMPKNQRITEPICGVY